MWDGEKIDRLDVIIEEVNGPCQDIILRVENAVELRDYLNDLLK